MKHSTRGIPKFPQVSLRRDKGHEAVSLPFFRRESSFTRSKRDTKYSFVGTSLPSSYFFLRVRKKTLFEGTFSIPSPEKRLIRDIPKFPQVSLRRDSSYLFLRVKKKKGHLLPWQRISQSFHKSPFEGTRIPKKGIRYVSRKDTNYYLFEKIACPFEKSLFFYAHEVSVRIPSFFGCWNKSPFERIRLRVFPQVSLRRKTRTSSLKVIFFRVLVQVSLRRDRSRYLFERRSTREGIPRKKTLFEGTLSIPSRAKHSQGSLFSGYVQCLG